MGIEDPNNTGTVAFYEPNVTTYCDNYPFGMPISSRTDMGMGYRYGFQRQELDNEIKGNGNVYDFGGRNLYDPRLGKFVSVDPWSNKYAWQSPYAYFLNSPIWEIDWNGFGGEGDRPDNQSKYLDIKKIHDNMMHCYRDLDKPDKVFWKILRARETMSRFSGIGKDFGTRNLGRYLMGEGGYDIYSVNFLNEYREFRVLRKRTNKKITEAVKRAVAKGMEAGAQSNGSFAQDRDQVEGIEGPLAPDYILAIGSAHMLANVAVDVSLDDDGAKVYTATVRYTFYDTYAWKKDFPALPHRLFGVISHNDAIALEKVGARVFKERAYFQTSFTWKEGDEIEIGDEYFDACDTDCYLEPDAEWDKVENEVIINDFRKKGL